MQISQQELIKSIINGVGTLIDARAKTLETNLKADIKSSEKRLTKRIVSVEERVEKVEDRLVKVEDRLVKVEDRLVKVEDRLVKVEDKLVKVENRLTHVEDKLDRNIDENGKKFAVLEESMGLKSM
jgi:septal ring factor EnvC (AmiA/AmiB activator)